jgi:nucleotide-binding universal stress UspA family protein
MNAPIRSMVAGVATLQPDDPALTAALALSRRTGAQLHLVHVDPADSSHGMGVSLSRSSALRGVVESVAPGATATPRVICRAMTGDPEQRLREAAAAAGVDLMLLGATRRGPFARAVQGTRATHLLRNARVPILVLRGALPDRPLRVLLTTDLSHHAAHAHARGLALARALGTGEPEMRSLFVQAPFLAEGTTPLPVPPQVDAGRELADFLEAEVPHAPITPCIRDGDPSSQIVSEAREWGADLVVMGTHGAAAPAACCWAAWPSRCSAARPAPCSSSLRWGCTACAGIRTPCMRRRRRTSGTQRRMRIGGAPSGGRRRWAMDEARSMRPAGTVWAGIHSVHYC